MTAAASPEKPGAGSTTGMPAGEGAGAVGAARTPHEADFSLVRPSRLTWRQMERMHVTFHALAQRLATAISRSLVTSASSALWKLEQMRFDNFVTQLPLPAALISVVYEPLERPWLVAFSPSLALAAVDRILGGSGTLAEEPRDLTSIEWTMLEPFTQAVIEGIAAGFAELVPLRGRQTGRFSEPRLARIASDHEVVISGELRVSGEVPESSVWLCILPDELEPLLQEREVTDTPEESRHRHHLSQHLLLTPMNFRALLGSADMTLGEVLKLEAGDVIRLDQRVEDPLVALVEDGAMFRGKIGVLAEKLAYQVQALSKARHPHVDS